jgi:replicative DNA helicase
MQLARAAERAVIGALLLEPARLADVHEWLRPDDFDGGAERQTYQAICHVTDRGEPLTPDLVDRQLREGKADGPVLADGAFLIGTMDACPAPSRASVYGRMVLELSIRRHIAADIAGLRHKAEQASTSEQLNTVFAQIDGVQLGVKNLHLREALAAHTASVAPNWAGELKPLSRFPRYEEGVVERQAVVALVDQPAALKTVARWLKPNDFSDDECASLFSELTVLREANNPIDGITVAWRARRVGISGPVCDYLVSPRDPADMARDPVLASRRVLEQSVKAAVIATTEELENVTCDGRTNTTSVAYARLNALWPQQRRLVKARFSTP